MDYDKYQIWLKDDPDNPFGVDIAVYLPWENEFVSSTGFLIEEAGVPYLGKTLSDGGGGYHKFDKFNSWYIGRDMTWELRVNHIGGELMGSGFGKLTGVILPDRFRKEEDND